MLKKVKSWGDSFVAPFLDNLHRPGKIDLLIAAIIFLVVFIALAGLTTETINNGDSAVYVQQMKDLDFAKRTVHLGYYLIGAAFVHTLPVSGDYAANLMNCSLGAMAISVLYLLAIMMCRHRIVAFVSALFLLTHFMFLINSVYAEVYGPQVCFILLATLLWLLDKPILAGISFALAVLITPSTIFAAPFFLILRPRWKPLLLFGTVSLIIAAIAIVPVYQDFFFGGRGLLKATEKSVRIGFALSKEAKEVFDNVFVCLPFLVVGVVTLFARKIFRPLGFALLTLWICSLVLGEQFRGVPVQLPLYAFLCLVSGLGFGWLYQISQAKRYVPAIVICAAALAIATNGYLTFGKVTETNAKHIAFRDTVMEIDRVAQGNYLVLGDWCAGTRFTHYLPDSQAYQWLNSEWLFGWWGNEKKDQATQTLNKAIAARTQIWLLPYKRHAPIHATLQRYGYKIAPVGVAHVANR